VIKASKARGDDISLPAYDMLTRLGKTEQAVARVSVSRGKNIAWDLRRNAFCNDAISKE